MYEEAKQHDPLIVVDDGQLEAERRDPREQDHDSMERVDRIEDGKDANNHRFEYAENQAEPIEIQINQ